MRRFMILAVLALLLIATGISANAQGNSNRPSGVATHIIVFNDNVAFGSTNPGIARAQEVANEMTAVNGLEITHTYGYAIRGFAAVVPAGRLNALRNDPRVAYIEENGMMTISAQSIPTGINRIFAPSNVNLDIDSTDDYRVDVDVAVIDTGIASHPDLNVVSHVNCTSGSCVNGGTDGNGHGTHVAGTIGALDNGDGVVGVAAGARLWGVKVLSDSGSGSNAGVIAGIDWVAARASSIEVANMSLGGSYSSAINTAVANAVNAGVVMVVAAGNESTNANTKSPASEPSAITVSALADFNGAAGGGAAATCRSDVDDTFANFSNYGSVVDIIAPGVCINSTWYTGGYNSISGTSMASPHVAGAAALLASRNNPSNASDVAAIRNTLVNNGNTNWNNSDDPDGIKERLLDVSNTSVFNPVLVAGGGGGGGGGGGSTVMRITDLDSSTSRWGSYYWYVTVTAEVRDGSGSLVSGAVVSMSASGAISGSGTCTTGTNGRCSLGTGWMYGGSYVTFTVSNVTKSGYTYDSSLNGDSDGGSNGTSITTYR